MIWADLSLIITSNDEKLMEYQNKFNLLTLVSNLESAEVIFQVNWTTSYRNTKTHIYQSKNRAINFVKYRY